VDASASPPGAPFVVLGAGYAGLSVAHGVWRRSKGQIPTVLVDRHPVHVLRTELYEIGRMLSAGGNVRPWTIPLARVFDRTSVQLREGAVRSVDLSTRTVHLESGDLPFRSLAICLGSVAAYYGIPGAAEHTHQVYRLSGAQRLATELRNMELRSVDLPGDRRPRVVIVGGGSTGTELATELATIDWRALVDARSRPPDVILVTGAVPLLAGLPSSLVEYARKTLRTTGVSLIQGVNVVRVDPGRVHLEDETVLACDVAVWCAGIEAPALVRDLPVPHGKGGRIAVDPSLEVPGHPGVFAVGDAAEFKDPSTGMLAPATAQAAVAEARAVATNVVARWNGASPAPFSYRERGVIVSLGLGQGAASLRYVSLWGRPASLLKRLVQREYLRTAATGEPSSLL
jgi:NADH:ubiquinone reductase (H+-translocating)